MPHVRFALRDHERGTSTGQLDGGWWPETPDLAEGVVVLVRRLREAGLVPDRITYRPAEWAAGPPRRVHVDGLRVTLEGFTTHPPHTVTAVGVTGWPRTVLLVVPPTADPVVAGRAIDLSVLVGELRSADGVLDLAGHTVHHPHGPDEPRWETDGGHLAPAA